MVNNDPKPVGSGASVLILRIQALINVRNFILIAFIVFFAATTLFLPKYRTYDTSGAIIVGMPPSEISKVQKAYELKFSELHQRFQVMQIEYSEEAAKWKQQIDHERSVYLQNVEALQERLAEEQKVRQAELERFQSVLSHRDTKIKAQEEEFRIISEKIVELQHRRDELYEFAAEAQRNQELVMQRIVEESKLSCEQLSSNTMKECEDHIAVIEKENKVLRSDLEAALEANTEMHASSEHTIVQLESQLNITIDHCNSQLLSQRQLYESRCSDEYLRERIGAVLNDRVRCPTPTPHDCDSICKVKVENKAIEVERSCRGNDPETELYRYDVDYALYSSGTKVMQNLTAPTYFPPSLHLSSIIKNRLRSVGLDEYQDFIPDFSGENVLNGVGLQLHRGLPIDALTTDLSLGSCWPMKGRRGNFTIALAHPITLTAISIDHISKDVARDWTTAPRAFSVYAASGVNEPMAWIYDGIFAWEKGTIHRFPLPFPTPNVSVITLSIHSNYGNKEYTCLYRFRVHGYSQQQQ